MANPALHLGECHPLCGAPWHLKLGSQVENVQRFLQKEHSKRGEEGYSYKTTPQKVHHQQQQQQEAAAHPRPAAAPAPPQPLRRSSRHAKGRG